MSRTNEPQGGALPESASQVDAAAGSREDSAVWAEFMDAVLGITGGGKIELRSFGDSRPAKQRFAANGREAAAIAENWDDGTATVAWGVSPRKPDSSNGKTNDVLAVAAVYVDLDHTEDISRLTNGPLGEPSAMVMSGGGLHAYWLLTRALSTDEAVPLQRAVVAAYGGDAQCADVARCLRVPATMNPKAEVRKRSRLLSLNVDRRIDPDLLRAIVAPELERRPTLSYGGLEFDTSAALLLARVLAPGWRRETRHDLAFYFGMFARSKGVACEVACGTVDVLNREWGAEHPDGHVEAIRSAYRMEQRNPAFNGAARLGELGVDVPGLEILLSPPAEEEALAEIPAIAVPGSAFMAIIDEPPWWFVEGLIPTGLTILCGPYSTHKTTIAAQAVLAATDDVQGELLGLRVNPARTVWVAPDAPGPVVRRLLRRVENFLSTRGRNVDWDRLSIVAGNEAPRIAAPSNRFAEYREFDQALAAYVEILRSEVALSRANVMVIDSRVPTANGWDVELDAHLARRLAERLESLADDLRIAIILLAHSPKLGGQGGSVQHAAGAGTALLISKKRDDFVLAIDKSWHAPKREIEFGPAPDCDGQVQGVEACEGNVKPRLRKSSQQEARVEATIAAAGRAGLCNTEIATRANVSGSRTREISDRLVKQGRVRRVGDRYFARSNADTLADMSEDMSGMAQDNRTSDAPL